MHELKSVAREAAEDIFFGQVVMNWARWFLIIGGMVLILWTAQSEVEAVLGIVPVVGLMAVNFLLHGRYLAERPANPVLITLASMLDVAVITLMVLLWSEQRGLESQFFIMYYPVVLAFAFVMPPRASVAYTALTLAAYTGACFLADPFFIGSVGDAKALLIRLITVGAMGGLATYYWRIQRSRVSSAAPRRSVASGSQVSS